MDVVGNGIGIVEVHKTAAEKAGIDERTGGEIGDGLDEYREKEVPKVDEKTRQLQDFREYSSWRR